MPNLSYSISKRNWIINNTYEEHHEEAGKDKDWGLEVNCWLEEESRGWVLGK